MNGLERLAAALSLDLATLGDDTDALADAAIREIGAAHQERDDALAQVAELEQQLEDAKAPTDLAVAAERARNTADHLIANAYREGKLRWQRDAEGRPQPSRFEAQLRKLAETGGVEELQAELEAMPQIVPIGKRVLDRIPEPPPTNGGIDQPYRYVPAPRELATDEDEANDTGDERAPNPYASTARTVGLTAEQARICEQMGLDPEDYAETLREQDAAAAAARAARSTRRPR